MSAWQLAKVVGKIQSCWRALGPVVRVMTRSCYSFICKSVDTYAWDYFQPLSKKARQELSFWRDNISDLHGYSFTPVMSEVVVDVVVASDASGVGVFAYLVDSSREVLGKRALTAEERTTSSTFREILALKEVYLGKNASRFSGLCVRHLTDNRGVAAAMEFGSPKEHIQEVVLDIFNQCRQLNIRLIVVWRSREDPAIQYLLSSLLQEVSDKSTIIGLVRTQSHQVLKVFGKRPWRRRDQEEFFRTPGTARRTRDSRRTVSQGV